MRYFIEIQFEEGGGWIWYNLILLIQLLVHHGYFFYWYQYWPRVPTRNVLTQDRAEPCSSGVKHSINQNIENSGEQLSPHHDNILFFLIFSHRIPLYYPQIYSPHINSSLVWWMKSQPHIPIYSWHIPLIIRCIWPPWVLGISFIGRSVQLLNITWYSFPYVMAVPSLLPYHKTWRIF